MRLSKVSFPSMMTCRNLINGDGCAMVSAIWRFWSGRTIFVRDEPRSMTNTFVFGRPSSKVPSSWRILLVYRDCDMFDSFLKDEWRVCWSRISSANPKIDTHSSWNVLRILSNRMSQRTDPSTKPWEHSSWIARSRPWKVNVRSTKYDKISLVIHRGNLLLRISRRMIHQRAWSNAPFMAREINAVNWWWALLCKCFE